MSDEQQRPGDEGETTAAGSPVPAPADEASESEAAAEHAHPARAEDHGEPGEDAAAPTGPGGPGVEDAAREGGDGAPAEVGVAADASAPEPEPEPEPAPEPAPRLAPAELKAIIEALVFAAPEPVTIKGLQKVLAEEPVEAIEAAVAALIDDYAGRGLQVAQVAGGYQITTRSELHEWVRRLFHERTTQKLSVQALETLAVIAYRQPVTAAEITEIRGVNASGVLSTLLERHLVKIVGRRNVVGRPFLYGTTKEFLIRFGLKDVTDLPKMEDMVAALGFEPPAMLVEKPVAEEMLPLEEDEVDVEDRPAAGAPEPGEPSS